MEVHLPYDVARMLGSGLGVIPGQRTIKTECGRRVPLNSVSWVEPDCEECLSSALTICEASLQALYDCRDAGIPNAERAIEELRRQRQFFSIRLNRAREA